ncbi:unnamed protein product [Lupinus luteus]|uniref:Wound-induced protein 1 n=1 Tax=Lupinus luteus TaxID=3873 RepID=A0AAV1XG89_LUPLU
MESLNSPKDLANLSEEADSKNQKLVLTLYDALNSSDSDTVSKTLASDLEWWFHGPPSHQFLMHILTGEANSVNDFRFVPQSIVSFGNIVIVEGCDGNRDIAWVHAWTVSDGIITQVREYLNTALTVTRIGNSQFDSDSDSDSGSEIVPAISDSARFTCVWESTVSDRVGKSVPGLVLAI